MGQKIDYNGVRALRGQRHNTQQTLTQVTPPPPPPPPPPRVIMLSWCVAITILYSLNLLHVDVDLT